MHCKIEIEYRRMGVFYAVEIKTKFISNLNQIELTTSQIQLLAQLNIKIFMWVTKFQIVPALVKTSNLMT